MQFIFCLLALTLTAIAAPRRGPTTAALASPMAIERSAVAPGATEVLSQVLSDVRTLDTGLNVTTTVYSILSSHEDQIAAEKDVVTWVDCIISIFNEGLSFTRAAVADESGDSLEANQISDLVVEIGYELSGTVQHLLDTVPLDDLPEVVAPVFSAALQMLEPMMDRIPDLSKLPSIPKPVEETLDTIFEHLPSGNELPSIPEPVEQDLNRYLNKFLHGVSEVLGAS